MGFMSPPAQPAVPQAPTAPTPPPVLGQAKPQGQQPTKKSASPTFLGSGLTQSAPLTGFKTLLGQ